MITASGVDPEALPAIVPVSTVISSMGAAFAGRWPELASIPWFPEWGWRLRKRGLRRYNQ